MTVLHSGCYWCSYFGLKAQIEHPRSHPLHADPRNTSRKPQDDPPKNEGGDMPRRSPPRARNRKSGAQCNHTWAPNSDRRQPRLGKTFPHGTKSSRQASPSFTRNNQKANPWNILIGTPCPLKGAEWKIPKWYLFCWPILSIFWNGAIFVEEFWPILKWYHFEPLFLIPEVKRWFNFKGFKGAKWKITKWYLFYWSIDQV